MATRLVNLGTPRPIPVKCDGVERLKLADLEEFQAGIKVHNVEWIARSIVDVGFMAPFFVWREDGHLWCIDGHGRLKALRLLEAEGFGVPLLPVVWVHPTDAAEARALVLRLNAVPYSWDQGELKAFIGTYRQEVGDKQALLAFEDLPLHQVTTRDLLTDVAASPFERPDYTDTALDKGNTKNAQYFYVEYYDDLRTFTELAELLQVAGLRAGAHALDPAGFARLVRSGCSG